MARQPQKFGYNFCEASKHAYDDSHFANHSDAKDSPVVYRESRIDVNPSHFADPEDVKAKNLAFLREPHCALKGKQARIHQPSVVSDQQARGPQELDWGSKNWDRFHVYRWCHLGGTE
jgi:esterase/lipase superfamily enzyme